MEVSKFSVLGYGFHQRHQYQTPYPALKSIIEVIPKYRRTEHGVQSDDSAS